MRTADRYFYCWFNHNLEARCIERKEHEARFDQDASRGTRTVRADLESFSLTITYHSTMTEADARAAVDDFLFNELPRPDWIEYRGGKTVQEGPSAIQGTLWGTVGQGGHD